MWTAHIYQTVFFFFFLRTHVWVIISFSSFFFLIFNFPFSPPTRLHSPLLAFLVFFPSNLHIISICSSPPFHHVSHPPPPTLKQKANIMQQPHTMRLSVQIFALQTQNKTKLRLVPSLHKKNDERTQPNVVTYNTLLIIFYC